MSDDAEPRELSAGIASLAVAAVGVLFAAVAWFAAGAHAGASVAVGAGLMALDVFVLGRVVRALFDPTDRSNKALWTSVGVFKLFALFGGSWWLLSSGLVQPLGLVAGIVALPVGLVAAAVSMSASAANRGRRSPA